MRLPLKMHIMAYKKQPHHEVNLSAYMQCTIQTGSMYLNIICYNIYMGTNVKIDIHTINITSCGSQYVKNKPSAVMFSKKYFICI